MLSNFNSLESLKQEIDKVPASGDNYSAIASDFQNIFDKAPDYKEVLINHVVENIVKGKPALDIVGIVSAIDMTNDDMGSVALKTAFSFNNDYWGNNSADGAEQKYKAIDDALSDLWQNKFNKQGPVCDETLEI